MIRKKKILWMRSILSLCITLAVISLGIYLSIIEQPKITTEIIKIPIAKNRNIVGQLYIPNTPPPYPLIIMFHGANSNKDFMSPMGRDLSRHNIAALAIDIGGLGESYPRPYSPDDNIKDAQAVLKYIMSFPKKFRANQIGLLGHSMGGEIALNIANTQGIKTTIILGMVGTATPYLPPNLLLGYGLYEQFYPIDTAQEMFLNATYNNSPLTKLTNFQQGTARKIVISGIGDHISEPFDPILTQHIIQWVVRSFNLPLKSSITLFFPSYLFGNLMIFSGGLSLAIILLLWCRPPRYIFCYWVVAIAALIYAIGLIGFLSGTWVSGLIIFNLILLIIGNYVLKTDSQFTTKARYCVSYALLIFITYVILAVLTVSKEIINQPNYLLEIPLFMIQWPIAILYSNYFAWRSVLFPIYSYDIQINPFILMLIIPELISPGIILSVFEKISSSIITFLRQPLKVNWELGIDERSLFILVASITCLIVISIIRIKEGLFDQAALIFSLKILAQHFFLRFIIIIAILRTNWFKNLEKYY